MLGEETPFAVTPGHRDRLPLGLPMKDAVTSAPATEFTLHGERLTLDADARSLRQLRQPFGRLCHLTTSAVDVGNLELGAVPA